MFWSSFKDNNVRKLLSYTFNFNKMNVFRSNFDSPRALKWNLSRSRYAFVVFVPRKEKKKQS